MSQNEVVIDGVKYIAVPLRGKGCNGCAAKPEGTKLCRNLPPCNRINRDDKRAVVFVAQEQGGSDG